MTSLVTPTDPASTHRPRSARERLTATLHGEISTAWTSLAIAAASARGRHHRVNEDCHSPLDDIAPVFVVADGVGGGSMAAWASRQLVSSMHRQLARRRIDADALRAALLTADRDIATGIAHRSQGSGAATVAVCAGTDRFLSRWLVAWVGDCRVYRVDRERHAHLLTSDDTYRHLSEEPPIGGSLDDPARMIGNGAVSAPNVERVALGWDEMLMLVSDGVHKHVDSVEMARVLGENAPLARRCLRLVEAARANGSQDDATVLVVYRRSQPRARLARLATALVTALLAASVGLAWLHAGEGSSTPSQQRSATETSP